MMGEYDNKFDRVCATCHHRRGSHADGDVACSVGAGHYDACSCTAFTESKELSPEWRHELCTCGCRRGHHAGPQNGIGACKSGARCDCHAFKTVRKDSPIKPARPAKPGDLLVIGTRRFVVTDTQEFCLRGYYIPEGSGQMNVTTKVQGVRHGSGAPIDWDAEVGEVRHQSMLREQLRLADERFSKLTDECGQLDTDKKEALSRVGEMQLKIEKLERELRKKDKK